MRCKIPKAAPAPFPISLRTWMCALGKKGKDGA